jgi:(1->4)-alpha-D-glucan 1-alpha-D-glucosylmutase
MTRGQARLEIRFTRVPAARHSIPTATYRLQFHPDFTFAKATGILDHLRALGISHVYSSPFFQAGAASTHGYDVADHNRINPALGGESQYALFVAALREQNLGHVLDFVPNHMGISEPINRWWMDVLENGPSSEFASYFDIEWHPVKEELENKVLLPILGDRYGRVLEAGEFKLSLENGAFFLRYYNAKLPLNPRSYPLILDRAARRVAVLAGTDFGDEFISISHALTALPYRSTADPELIQTRAREKEVCKRRLAHLVSTAPKIAAAIDETLRELEGRAAEPASFDPLDGILDGQAYRLAYWRVAAEEINYRRFFDVNTLAAIRPEVPEVFEASHELVFKMIERGDVTGLRIDHIDGLWNPRAYLNQLRQRFPDQQLYLIVEKILAADEWLPAEWPVDGTTGYEFASDVTGLLIDASAEQKLTEFYTRFAEDPELDDLLHEKKLFITRMAMASEMTTLGRMLSRISEAHRHYRDFTLGQLTAAVRETMACFPLYRTYVEPGELPRGEDRLTILRTVRKARRRNPWIDKPVFDFLAKVLLLELPETRQNGGRGAQTRFALRFQQCTGPVMAKSVEDTAFYIYNRFVALNEVGSEPGRFGLPVADFHARCVERRRRCPHTLLTTSTHDTKRSEDVRARLAAISELPDEWRKAVTKWTEVNASLKSQVDGCFAPSPNEEYLLYQSLAGAWPLEPLTDRTRSEFVARIQDYMVKALKEAKLNSSWIDPDEEWEMATRDFVALILDPVRGKRFLRHFEPFVSRLAQFGAVNSLTQIVLKCTTPGVPDFYQGCETWDFSLVDPDNRRPVDYERSRSLLATLRDATPPALIEDWRSGAVKVFVTQRLLNLRRDMEQVFSDGTYRALETAGPHAERIVAFVREHGDAAVAVVVPRLTVPLGFPAIGKVWRDTTVNLPPGRWRNAFSPHEMKTSGAVRMADILQEFPFACLVRG